jgi:hypothetical protein
VTPLDDPFGWLAGEAARVLTDSWSGIMLTIWNAGLFLLRLVLKFEGHFLTPDLSAQGPARDAYAMTFWSAAVLALIMIMIQIGITVAQRDGKALARVAIGVAQFVLVWVAWLVYGAAVIAACGGLNDAMMRSMFGVKSWDAWQPAQQFRAGDLVDASVATVLGLLGLFLWIAAIAHLLVILTRAAALITLAATTPICAAGLVSDVGRGWFWKSLRWFHAAALTPVVMTLIMGIGNKLATGVSLGLGDKTATAVGSAVPSVLMIIVSAVAPLALFKLLAFVDPGTNSGASVRAGLAAVGGLSGLLGGRAAGQSAGGSSEQGVTEGDVSGRSQAEGQGEAATTQRFVNAQAGIAAQAGPLGQLVGAGLRGVATVGSVASAIATDTTNQMGVGHNTYQPDLARTGRPEPGPDKDTSGRSWNDGPSDTSPAGRGADQPEEAASGGRSVGDPWGQPPRPGGGPVRGIGPKPPGGAATGGEAAGGAEAAAVAV